MCVFKTERTFLMIKHEGKLRHIPAQVSYAFEHDTDTPDFDYGNELENKREMQRFESGELSNVLLKVSATALGEIGYDYLGQNFVVTRDMEKQLIQTSIEHDMKNVACLELRNSILLQYKTLKEALEGATV